MDRSDIYIQVNDGVGWNIYAWGDGLKGALKSYRKVRQVYMPSGEDGFFERPKLLKVWKDGRRIK